MVGGEFVISGRYAPTLFDLVEEPFDQARYRYGLKQIGSLRFRFGGMFATCVQIEGKMTINDIGPKPQSFNLEQATKENTAYRSVAWSGRYLQVTLMSIPVGEDIGLEAHPETDQFLRLDAGRGRVQMGAAKDDLTFEKEVADGWCVLVPAGTWHNITNIGTNPLQVYTIYAPAHHKPGKVQATAAVAEADKDDEPAAWSVQPKHAPDKHG